MSKVDFPEEFSAPRFPVLNSEIKKVFTGAPEVSKSSSVAGDLTAVNPGDVAEGTAAITDLPATATTGNLLRAGVEKIMKDVNEKISPDKSTAVFKKLFQK